MSIGVTRRTPERLPDATPHTRTPLVARAEPSTIDTPRDRAVRSAPETSILESGGSTERVSTARDLSGADRLLETYRSKGSSAKEDHDAGAGAGVDAGADAGAPPVPPPSMGQLGALCDAADDFAPTAAIPEARVAEIRAHLHAAEDALRAGDYARAETEFAALGYPLPADETISTTAADTAVVIGGAEVGDSGIVLHHGAHGDQELNDLIGYAANAHMMATLERAGIHPSGNPPTRDEARSYMEGVARDSGGDPARALEASRMMVEGMVVHYSSAGEDNPVYGRDPTRYVLDMGAGERRTFATRREAEAAALEMGRETTDVHTSRTSVPSDWDDAMSMGTRAGRHVGDCESKLYLQNQLLEAAGFTPLGTVDVDHGESGHVLGVLRAPDASVWVTSNAESTAARGTGPDGAVTETDIERAAHAATRATYGLGESGSLADFDFAYGAQPMDATGEPGVEGARRAAENHMFDLDELFLSETR